MPAKKTQAADDVAKEAAGENKAIVIKEFRARNDFETIHKVGDDVSDLPKEVLESLLDREYIELTGDLDSIENPTIGYKAQLEEVIKDAPDEVKKAALETFLKNTWDGPNHFGGFLNVIKQEVARQG